MAPPPPAVGMSPGVGFGEALCVRVTFPKYPPKKSPDSPKYPQNPAGEEEPTLPGVSGAAFPSQVHREWLLSGGSVPSIFQKSPHFSFPCPQFSRIPQIFPFPALNFPEFPKFSPLPVLFFSRIHGFFSFPCPVFSFSLPHFFQNSQIVPFPALNFL